MKNIILVFLFLISSICVDAQLIEDLDRAYIVSKNVKVQSTFEYEVVRGKRAAKGVLTKELHFDNQGNIVKQVNFKRNGSVHSVLNYKYDDNGNKIQYEKYIGAQDSLNYKQNVKFDNKGKRVYEKGFDGVDSFRIVYNYNKLNKLVESIYYTGKTIDEKRVFEYIGNTSNIKVLNKKGEIQYTLQNVYNNNNKLIEEKRIEKDNTISKRTVYEYNADNKITSETKYIGQNVVNKIISNYNAKGQIFEVVEENVKGEKYIIKKYTYDAAGVLVEEQYRSGSNKDFSKNTFKYNDKGVCESVDTYFATYNYQTLSVFTYEYYQ